MYLSRIRLKETASRAPDFWRIFRDPYTLHKSIWKLFADHADRRRDFLYRLEEGDKEFRVYTVSARAPSAESELWSVDTKLYQPNILCGMPLVFSLRANPARKKNGKRHDVVMESKQRLRAADGPQEDWPSRPELAQEQGRLWLEARSEIGGFHVQSVRIEGYRRHQFPKSGALVRISTMDFTGILTVSDPEQFVRVLGSGIGPAKAFGCGLLLVRRLI